MERKLHKSGRKIWSTLLLLFLFLTSFSLLNAQVTVTGTVTSADDDAPMPGVNIIEQGTTNGAITNADGTYSISVSAEAVLMYSFVGMVAQEITVGVQTIIDVVLASGTTALDEIVVVGYGTAAKASLTGAVASIRGDELKQSPSTNFSNTLVGRIPGLFAFNESGEPGYDGATLRIRGANTLGDNNPLIVIDGIPNRSLDRLDPAVIESFTVLKDASAAIYGTQAANGVILITTKRGKAGKPTVTVDMNVGAQQPTVIPDMADAATYATMLNEIAYYNDPGSGMNQVYSAADIQAYGDGSDPWGHPNTDWFNEVFKPWSLQHYENVSVRGGSENLKYFLSFGNKFQDAIYYNSATYYSQQDFRTNIDGKITENIDLSFDVAARSENRHFPTVGQWDSFRMLMRGKPNMPAFWPNGDPGPDIEYGHNPAVTTTDATGYNDDKNYYLETNLRLNVKIPWVKGLTVQGNFSYDKHIRYQKVFETPWYLYTWNGSTTDPQTTAGQRGLEAPQMTQRAGDDYKMTYNAYVTYDTEFGGSNLKIMAGTESQKGLNNWLYAFRKNYVAGDIDELFAGATDQYMANDGSASQFARKSYFGRINYNYNEKYLAEFVMRYDGSYMFDDAWGFFPGISLGWRIVDESFWSDNISFFDDFKIRASWGQTGNDRIYYDNSLQEYKYLTLYGFVDNRSYVFGVDNDNKLLYEQAVPNPNVTWEVANQFNVGFNTAFLNNQMTLEADYFHNLRTNILWRRNASVPSSAGLSLPPENIGEVLNQGFEFVLGFRGGSSDGVRYTISLNGSYARNEILFWDETPGIPDYQQSTGSAMGAELYYESLGVFETQADVDAYPHWAGAQPGDIQFRDVNDDGVIDGLDRVRNDKSGLPFFTGGLSASLYVSNFDISVLLQGVSGAVAYISPESGEIGNYYNDQAVNRWTPTNPSSEYPRAWNRDNEYWRSQGNTYWLHETDYIRLKNIEIGYNLPDRAVNAIGIAALRVYANGLNLLTFSGEKLIDPELSSGQAYPLQRIINLGLTLTF
jgi:TonB-dependent starch-binding outer membrane protein SusC